METKKFIDKKILERNGQIKGYDYSKPVDGRELHDEIVKSHRLGKLTDRAFTIIENNVVNMISPFVYQDETQRSEMISACTEICITKWMKYDYVKYNDAFSFFREVSGTALYSNYNKVNDKFIVYTLDNSYSYNEE